MSKSYNTALARRTVAYYDILESMSESLFQSTFPEVHVPSLKESMNRLHREINKHEVGSSHEYLDGMRQEIRREMVMNINSFDSKVEHYWKRTRARGSSSLMESGRYASGHSYDEYRQREIEMQHDLMLKNMIMQFSTTPAQSIKKEESSNLLLLLV